MTYLLQVQHAERNSNVVFQTRYADLALATRHVAEIAAKYPPAFTVKLFDAAGAEIASADGTKAGVHYDLRSKALVPDEPR